LYLLGSVNSSVSTISIVSEKPEGLISESIASSVPAPLVVNVLPRGASTKMI
jgi:hypothetical protein